MIDGGTSVAALWWMFGPMIADKLSILTAVSAVLVLGVAGLANLIVGHLGTAAVPETHDDNEDVEPAGPARPTRRQGGSVHASFSCTSGSDATLVLHLPDEVSR